MKLLIHIYGHKIMNRADIQDILTTIANNINIDTKDIVHKFIDDYLKKRNGLFLQIDNKFLYSCHVCHRAVILNKIKQCESCYEYICNECEFGCYNKNFMHRYKCSSLNKCKGCTIDRTIEQKYFCDKKCYTNYKKYKEEEKIYENVVIGGCWGISDEY